MLFIHFKCVNTKQSTLVIKVQGQSEIAIIVYVHLIKMFDMWKVIAMLINSLRVTFKIL